MSSIDSTTCSVHSSVSLLEKSLTKYFLLCHRKSKLGIGPIGSVNQPVAEPGFSARGGSAPKNFRTILEISNFCLNPIKVPDFF
jgi:hypothetical protein